MKFHAVVVAVAAVGTIVGCAPMSQTGGMQTGGLGLPQAGTVAGQIPSVGTPAVGGAAGQAAAGVGLPQTGTGMGGIAGSVPAVGTPGLVDILVRQLGITNEQALGGAGSIFSVAQQHLSVSDFTKLSGAVPGMDQYLAAAPKAAASTSGSAGLLGAAGTALGGSSLGSMAALAGSFQSLGLSPGMVGQFVPVVLDYVQGQGGSSAMGLLQSALR